MDDAKADQLIKIGMHIAKKVGEIAANTHTIKEQLDFLTSDGTVSLMSIKGHKESTLEAIDASLVKLDCLEEVVEKLEDISGSGVVSLGDLDSHLVGIEEHCEKTRERIDEFTTWGTVSFQDGIKATQLISSRMNEFSGFKLTSE